MPIFGKRTKPRDHNPCPGNKRPRPIITPGTPFSSTHPPVNPKTPMPPVKPPRTRERVYCRDCFFWDTNDAITGQCHFDTPQDGPKLSSGKYEGRWRITMNGDWCGKGERKPLEPSRDNKEATAPLIRTTSGYMVLPLYCADCGQQVNAYYHDGIVMVEKCNCNKKNNNGR